MKMKSSVLEVLRFGAALQNYSPFSRIQKAFQEFRKSGEIPDTLLTLQVLKNHSPQLNFDPPVPTSLHIGQTRKTRTPIKVY